MSKKIIERELLKKGLFADITYVRSEPTPTGYASGWDIDFTDESWDKLIEVDFQGIFNSDCRNVKEVLEYIKTLPDLNNLEKG